MNGACSGLLCGIQYLFDVEIRFLRRISGKRERNIRLADEERRSIMRRMRHARFVAAFACGTNDAPRDLRAICNKDVF